MTRQKHSSSQVRAVMVVVIILGAMAAVAVRVGLGPDRAPTPGPDIPWWFLVAAFAITEVWVLHVQVRREAQTMSLSEIPLVLGLLFAAPGIVIIGRLLGPLAATGIKPDCLQKLSSNGVNLPASFFQLALRGRACSSR